MTNKNAQKEEYSLLNLLTQIKDNRRKQGQRHPLHILFLITVMAIMQGAKSERAIARFAINNKASLIKELEITRGEVPSRRILAQFIQTLDFNKLQSLFHTWTSKFVNIKKGEWLSIDGKAIRGTITNANNPMQDFMSLVTVFANKKKQALAVGKINTKKENEIPTVRNLIEMLDLQGVTFTLDALHCQTKTTQTIIKTKNNYVIGVKDNQKNLLKQLKKTVKVVSV
ncbi:ISAs1 family transposase [Patescibacteria group bacterium]|nr:ISAs1 family transposase [Patescibacteria group bacterium]